MAKEFMDIVDEIVKEQIELMDEVIQEEIMPLLKYQKEAERKIADKAIKDMYEAEEGL